VADGAEAVRRNIAAQREWYGEPLGDRVRRLLVAFGISQGALAAVLGLSPPMLSQLVSGRRAKIGNPGALARLVALERKVLVPGVAAGSSEAMLAALDEVRLSHPAVTRDTLPLNGVAEPAELRAAAELLQARFPQLAEALRRAGDPP
jgi:transcriptional regulator with XRE-family HTH domain